MKSKFPGEDHLYLQVAEGVEKMIGDDILRIGDKLPSVRVLSKEHGISMGTAFQAYYHLEGKGLIESRPKSGYYVRFNPRRFADLPKKMDPVVTPVEKVTNQDMIMQMIKTMTAEDIMNFALASPSVNLLPAARLSKSVVHALRNDPHQCLQYEHAQGNPELRKQIARLSFNWGGKVKPDEVIITSGCMEAVVMALRSVTHAGDTIAVECPSYFGIYQVIESLGLKLIEIPADPVTGIDLDGLERAIGKHSIAACLLVPNFSNPSGSCMPDEHKQRLVQMLTKHQVPLIEDDIYGEMYFGRQRPRTCKYFDKEGIVLYCSSLSKSLAPGYRIGWILPGRYMDKVSSIKMMHSISCATITQQALAHFLGIGRYEYHLKNLRKALHTQCLRYTQAIMQYFPEETRISRPQGGFVLWVELSKHINTYELWLEAMKHQISIAPGSIFSNSANYSHYMRIGYGKPWDDKVDKGLKTLGNLVRKMS
ncbi:PLP-dependent aminotransferase family protein [Pseudobacter ginsenosidimutans]|uniref:DNA-binding transcriptional MocR family regulator n=1 Tax=Pseudobacter ginsenosidimutans TaxID=661488 RepID=A0A4Q7MUX3_9BACT|nr:PLP-dependent aminotransferase family protein [Pseudobacter ginsenosidimutans]QEC40574.1 PLP-dependent aminotransferase family protein [Pseudobacter ginsenosidimutans]RZS72712.1 DNA-binding transcriptional MocR family regulator [Pseudobacter ginsenosidimutans]